MPNNSIIGLECCITFVNVVLLQYQEKSKLLTLVFITTSLFGYLARGPDNSSFLLQIEHELIIVFFYESKVYCSSQYCHSSPKLNFTKHSYVQKIQNRFLIYIGNVCLGLLLGFMVFIGVTSFNFVMLVAILPFFIIVLLVIRNFSLYTTQS